MKRAWKIAACIALCSASVCVAEQPDLLALPDSPVIDAAPVAPAPTRGAEYQIKRRIVVAQDGAVDAPCDASEIIDVRGEGDELEITRMGVQSIFRISSREPVAVWGDKGPVLTGAYRGLRLTSDGAIEQVVVTEGAVTIVTTGSALQTVTTVFASRIADQPKDEIAWNKKQP